MPKSLTFRMAVLLALSGVAGAQTAQPVTVPDVAALDILKMRSRSYPGSALTTVQVLRPGSNYRRSVVSYRSDGLRINALLTVPNGTPPKGGWPAIVFNHGYVPPNVYRTTERYVAYQDAFARAGYVTIKSDYRGHGSSEGEATGAYWSPGYTNDVLNATASLRKFPGVDPNRIGMWGHSMGGHLTLRAMVIDKNIKVGVIWAGVVVDYDELMTAWRRPGRAAPPGALRRRELITAKFGTPKANPAFWQAVSPNFFLKDVSGPIQIHHGSADTDVPLSFGQSLARQLRAAGKPTELYTYAGDDHNLSRNLRTALNRSVAYFDKVLKPGL
jgi:dipeptidyl aminopeptidase/acylaminoacyl peptidase